nr:uncharacterized protein LOC127293599 [Lolium perenne]
MGSQVWRDVLGAAEGGGPLRGLTAAAMPEWQWQSSQDAAVEYHIYTQGEVLNLTHKKVKKTCKLRLHDSWIINIQIQALHPWMPREQMTTRGSKKEKWECSWQVTSLLFFLNVSMMYCVKS